MKKTFFILTILFFCCHKISADTKIPIELLKIYDGDTILAKIDNEQFSIRLVNIDCYETSEIHRAYKQAYQNNLKIEEVLNKGKDSKEFLEKLYKNNQNKQVFLDFRGVDKYGRVLGVVYFDKTNVNDELLKHGGCLEYEYRKSSF